jgi:methyl-accepting chemotaxis protein
MAQIADVIAEVAQEAGRLGLEVADIVGYVEDINSHLTGQAEIFGNLSAAAEDMARGNDTIHRAVMQAREASADARTRSASSRLTLEQAVETIRQLAQAVETIAAEAVGFEDNLRQITQISAKISAISKQTNLLALNATIEAPPPTRSAKPSRA